MHVAIVAVCLTLGMSVLIACSSSATTVSSPVTPTPSDEGAAIAAGIIAENEAVLDATMTEKSVWKTGKDIYVTVVVADSTVEAEAGLLIDRILRQLEDTVEGDNISFSIMLSRADGTVVVSMVTDPVDRFLDKEDRR